MWRAEVTHDNDRREFRTGIVPAIHVVQWRRSLLYCRRPVGEAFGPRVAEPPPVMPSPDVIRGRAGHPGGRRHGWPYPVIHVVKLANGQMLSRTKTLRCARTTWMAGTSPCMTVAPRHPFHPPGSAEDRGRTRLTFSTASGRQKPPLYPLAFSETFWSGRRDSNPRPQPWQEVGGPTSNLAPLRHGHIFALKSAYYLRHGPPRYAPLFLLMLT